MALGYGFRGDVSSMKASDCSNAAERNLYDARRYIETGEAINWVPDSLSTALLWAMEAWLMANNFEVNRGKGWDGTREAFWNVAPAELRSQVMSCYAKITFLVYDLEGGFKRKEPLPSREEWKKSASKCLEDAEMVIPLLIGEAKGHQINEKSPFQNKR